MDQSGRPVSEKGQSMGYEMEELVPIVAELTEKYTGKESTSITYEKAEQLMQAVLYCIAEAERGQTGQGPGTELKTGHMSAREAYQMGYDMVTRKVQKAMALYHAVLQDFDSYGNQCLEDTFAKGMPEFFKWYDRKFQPQNTILTLDYPVLAKMRRYRGIDAIYRYLQCIQLEQQFLGKLEKNYVVKCLSRYDASYRSMVDNISQAVYTDILTHALIKKSLSEEEFTEPERERLKQVLLTTEFSALEQQLRQFTIWFAEKYYDGNKKLAEYLSLTIKDSLVRLKIISEFPYKRDSPEA